MKKVVLTKGNLRKEFAPKAAEIAVAVYGWSELPEMPSEVGQYTQPIPIKRKIEPPVIQESVDPPIKNDPPASEIKATIEEGNVSTEKLPPADDTEKIAGVEKPKAKRSPRKK